MAGTTPGHEYPPLPDDLLDRLNEIPVRPVIEYVALRLGLVDGHDGHWSMRFELERGTLRRAEISHSQIGNTELETMGVKGE